MRDLFLFNSLTRKKEKFQPNKPGCVDLYVCGVTVYDHCHMGHAKTYVAFDIMVRYLKAIGYRVNYVRNITDIDDKIINRANEKGVTFESINHDYTKDMHEDFNALGLLEPMREPKATEHIEDIINMISTLVDNESAYVAANGDVYFDVTTHKSYGALSKKDVTGQEAGARIEVLDIKRNAHDFVLWKQKKDGEPGWPSPWGEGRPGWHIECSAMNKSCFGANVDIHGGGQDLMFPHHENEMAQSECANGEKFVNYWLHVGFLQIDKEKMSKSLGNFFTIREVLQKYQPEVLRYFLTSSHYRSQLNYSAENLEQAKTTMINLYQTIRGLNLDTGYQATAYTEKFYDAMADDFNTPVALSVLCELSHEINKLKSQDSMKASSYAAELRDLGKLLGILQLPPNEFLHAGVSDETVARVVAIIKERQRAREEKDWAHADKLRDELTQMGIVIEDKGDETTWRVE